MSVPGIPIGPSRVCVETARTIRAMKRSTDGTVPGNAGRRPTERMGRLRGLRRSSGKSRACRPPKRGRRLRSIDEPGITSAVRGCCGNAGVPRNPSGDDKRCEVTGLAFHAACGAPCSARQNEAWHARRKAPCVPHPGVDRYFDLANPGDARVRYGHSPAPGVMDRRLDSASRPRPRGV